VVFTEPRIGLECLRCPPQRGRLAQTRERVQNLVSIGKYALWLEVAAEQPIGTYPSLWTFFSGRQWADSFRLYFLVSATGKKTRKRRCKLEAMRFQDRSHDRVTPKSRFNWVTLLRAWPMPANAVDAAGVGTHVCQRRRILRYLVSWTKWIC